MTGRAKVTLLLVEDYRLMFEGLSSILAEYPDFNVVGVATSVKDAVEKAVLLKPDLVLMDYRLPDGDGVQATERIRVNLPDTAILFLSSETSESAVMRAVEAGASGFVSKAATAEELVGAIRQAAAGEFLLETATMARLLEARRQIQDRPGQPAEAPRRLTPREQEVLRLLAGGLDNGEIATHLGIEYGAVRTNVRGALEKLGAHTRAQAVAAAGRAGLLDG
ncbi:MAG: response regulator transcription factor [Chloroflexi bacterium]|nr:MAG: response regulator transcription factor [Chloroflexota bacterium]